ncbi:MAG TPA: type II toxin-antitoxin system RelE/ParE family toxin [Candidatus Sulfotelmatobacter sp.]|jgi:mRNA interferase RelE/StbE|nr:type II toxin-antitoxin system RelE/ParE family toxin [Candidatus Sulfotelmatobacter sp.]
MRGAERPLERSWQIEITRTAEKQIRKLSRSPQKIIQRFLRERLMPAENPRQWGKPLHGEKRSLWRYRVGDYRLICDIQDERLVVLLLEVGHRKDVYR